MTNKTEPNSKLRQTSPRSTVRQLLCRLLHQEQGVAAVEFALLLPFMLILFIGVSELSFALNCDRKVAQTASSVADLISQESSVSSTDIEDVMEAASEIMEPYSDPPLEIIMASISFDSNGNATVDWSQDEDGNSPWQEGSTPPIDVPSALSENGASLIVGDATYTYTPLFASLFQNIFPRATTINLNHVYFLRPRLSDEVTLDD